MSILLLILAIPGSFLGFFRDFWSKLLKKKLQNVIQAAQCSHTERRLFNLTIHTHICGTVHNLCLDHVHLNLSPLCTTVHSVVQVIQAALTFFNLSKFEWVTAFLLRLVHTLCSDQMFGSTQVLLKMANVSIVSMDPHQRLVDQPNLHLYTLCTHVQCRGFESKQIIYFWVDMSQVGSNLRLSDYAPCDLVILTNHRRALSFMNQVDQSQESIGRVSDGHLTDIWQRTASSEAARSIDLCRLKII